MVGWVLFAGMFRAVHGGMRDYQQTFKSLDDARRYVAASDWEWAEIATEELGKLVKVSEWTRAQGWKDNPDF